MVSPYLFNPDNQQDLPSAIIPTNTAVTQTMIKSNSGEVSSIRLQANERIGTPERNSSRDHQIQPNWFEQSSTDVTNKRPADVFSSLQTARDRSVSKENTR